MGSLPAAPCGARRRRRSNRPRPVPDRYRAAWEGAPRSGHQRRCRAPQDLVRCRTGAGGAAQIDATPVSQPALVLLAAGESSRMGAPKGLLPWRGRIFLQTQVETFDAAFPTAPVVVVLGRDYA